MSKEKMADILEFNDPDVLSVEQISELLPILKPLKDWIKKIEDYALNSALNKGVVYEGYKLVETRGRSSIAYPEELAKELIELGYDSTAVYKPREVIGMADLKSLLGTKVYKAVVESTKGHKHLEDGKSFIAEGKISYALVPKSDKRAEYVPKLNTAEDDFGDILDDFDL